MEKMFPRRHSSNLEAEGNLWASGLKINLESGNERIRLRSYCVPKPKDFRLPQGPHSHFHSACGAFSDSHELLPFHVGRSFSGMMRSKGLQGQCEGR